jgi:hypothetical protein
MSEYNAFLVILDEMGKPEINVKNLFLSFSSNLRPNKLVRLTLASIFNIAKQLETDQYCKSCKVLSLGRLRLTRSY